MCGRYTLFDDKQTLESYFGAELDISDYQPTYNVAPSHRMPVVGANADGKRSLKAFRWGLLPFWADKQNVGYNMINARSETVDRKKSFRRYFQRQRCLIPASGFYEWNQARDDKNPFYIQPTSTPLFSFAGIYSQWSPNGSKKDATYTYSILTTPANDKMSDLHDRMPAMLPKENWDAWLDPSNNDTTALKKMLVPSPNDAIDYYRVSQAVNSVKNNMRDLIQRADLF